MSVALDWAGLLASPVAAALALGLKGTFDRQVKKASVQKTDAEVSEIYAKAATILVAPLNERIDSLTLRVATLESQNAATTGKLRRAVNYIRELLTWIGQSDHDEVPPQPPADLMYLT